MAFEDLKIEVSRIADKKEDSATSKMTAICELLRERIEYYDWVGF